LEADIYLEVLVGSLLPLLVHGVRSRLGGQSDGGEESETGGQADDNAPGNAGTSSGRVSGTGAVRAESNPVCCIRRV
jgi:hypothetical protein